MQQSPVFEETYQRYLNEIRGVDILSRADILGVKRDNDSLLIPLYEQTYKVSQNGVEELSGAEITPAVRVILCKYILACPKELPLQQQDMLKTYREFRDASPLISYFTTNTNKTIESTFSGDIAALRSRSRQLKGVELTSESYDFSVQFHALPRIPVVLNFNDRDDLFPAVCSVLYRASAESYLDMECLAMTGTLLAGKLIKPEGSAEGPN